jgi:hypothetical protein
MTFKDLTFEQIKDLTHFLARIVFSIVFIGIGFYLLKESDEGTKKLGAGFLGTVIGFWVK